MAFREVIVWLKEAVPVCAPSVEVETPVASAGSGCAGDVIDNVPQRFIELGVRLSQILLRCLHSAEGVCRKFSLGNWAEDARLNRRQSGAVLACSILAPDSRDRINRMGRASISSRDAEFIPRKILLIENSVADADLLRVLLRVDPRVCVMTVARLAKGIAQLSREHFDLVLLDLSLPDCEGEEAVRKVHRAAPGTPIVALSAVHDEQLGIRALREGAQDWLVPAEIDRSLLMRVIRYACERQRLMTEVHSLALVDTLTGLYNRRGFVTIAEEQFKLARRTGHSITLAFVDFDGMKRINDEVGHEIGDQALLATARLLKSTFRAADIVARLGGDEFIVLLAAAGQTVSDRLRKRLLRSVAAHNETPGVVAVSLSIGFAHYNPLTSKQTLEQVMNAADQAMYLEKQSHRGSRTFQDRQRRALV